MTMQLTPTQERAQRAVLEPDVIEMARRLASYGLGITMPHMHTATEDFADLPNDMIQVERAGAVTFEPKRAAQDDPGMVAVGWRWEPDGLSAIGRCVPIHTCTGSGSPTGHRHENGHTNYP